MKSPTQYSFFKFCVLTSIFWSYHVKYSLKLVCGGKIHTEFEFNCLKGFFPVELPLKLIWNTKFRTAFSRSLDTVSNLHLDFKRFDQSGNEILKSVRELIRLLQLFLLYKTKQQTHYLPVGAGTRTEVEALSQNIIYRHVLTILKRCPR